MGLLTKVYTKPDIYSIDIPLPENPLKNLNCYVVLDGGDTLIIDTGFHRPECLAAMKAGLKELGVELDQVSLFLTHLHSDHTGLAYQMMEGRNRPIYMGDIDYAYFKNSISGNGWEETEKLYEEEGLPKEMTKALRQTNPARSFAPSGVFDAITVKDGDKISVGAYEFTCVWVPGHTPGQMCLYLPERKLMFTADHILFDITPNITSWLGVEDSLGDYLQSLQKISTFAIETALPAHRKNDMDVYVRIRQIQEHHKARLEDTLYVLDKEPDMTSYETAARMKWSMRGKCWEEFPVHQRWFAMGETMAHLNYLMLRDMITKTEGEKRTYRLKHDLKKCLELLQDGYEKGEIEK